MPRYRTQADLQRIYGEIGFHTRVVYSNFVASLDGVVTLGSTPSAGSVISGRDRHDRFLMALLRACAQAVLLGAGTLRGTPGHLWTAEHVFPDMAASFATLRAGLGLDPQPRLVLITGSGDIDMSHPAIAAGATIATTSEGAAKIKPRLPESCDLIELGKSGPVDVQRVLAEMSARGYDVVLTEGGPHLLGMLVADNLLDEAFLTVSPVIAGRDHERRLGMVAGIELLPGRGAWSRLMSVRRHADHLFLRYATKRPQDS